MQLLIGAVVVAEEMATKGCQLSFASLFRDAIGWAVEVRDVLAEIAADATYGADLVVRVASDGKITADEVAELSKVFNEIEVEALEGRIA